MVFSLASVFQTDRNVNFRRQYFQRSNRGGRNFHGNIAFVLCQAAIHLIILLPSIILGGNVSFSVIHRKSVKCYLLKYWIFSCSHLSSAHRTSQHMLKCNQLNGVTSSQHSCQGVLKVFKSFLFIHWIERGLQSVDVQPLQLGQGKSFLVCVIIVFKCKLKGKHGLEKFYL